MIEALDRSSFDGRQVIPTPLASFDPVNREVRRIYPAVSPIWTLDGNDIHAELLTLDKLDTTEMEFSLTSHLIVLLPDGMSGGCEWSDGRRVEKLSSVAPNTIIFNPAHEYLCIRKRKSQNQCRMLLLTIRPTILSRLDDGELDVTDVQFSQQIGVEDQGARQALVAIQQEIESPGVNSKLYVDALLMLLLNRLVRCASNFAVPREPKYAKGGLPNWRLKGALQLLEGDLSKTPSISELAETIHLHPTSFCRAFKQSTGVSPHRYLLIHRINCAKEMMNDQNRTLTQIALDCGFSGSSQFSVVFKRIAGTSPRTYRRSL